MVMVLCVDRDSLPPATPPKKEARTFGKEGKAIPSASCSSSSSSSSFCQLLLLPASTLAPASACFCSSSCFYSSACFYLQLLLLSPAPAPLRIIKALILLWKCHPTPP